MEYNELKLKILQILAKTGPIDSRSLAKSIAELKHNALDIHAIRMALMRYYRLGLLRRERAAGQFTYALTERGLRRLRWLEQQTRKTEQ